MNHSTQFLNLYHNFSLNLRYYTDDQLSNELGYKYGLDILWDMHHSFDSGLFLGIAASVSGNQFKNGDHPIEYQNRFSSGLSPYLEYQVAEKVTLRTVLSFSWYNSRAESEYFNTTQPEPYQTFGVAYSFDTTFLYTYLWTHPFQGKFDTENIFFGLSAIVNLF